MRRLAALAALTTVWVPIVIFAVTRGDDVADFAEIDAVVAGVDAADPQWVREGAYVEYALTRRVPRIVANDQFPAAAPTNPDRIRVLVLGDSFTYGWGLTDLDVRWPEILERELDARTAPGTFEVVTVATAGTSTYTHAMWLRDIAAGNLASWDLTVEQAAMLREKFDAVVIGYVTNDITAAPNDVFEGKDRFVELDDQAAYRVQIGAADDPNEDLHRRAIASIAASVTAMDAAPVWLPLTFAIEGGDPLTRVRGLFTDAGFVIGSNDDALATIRTHDRSALTVSPIDTHPGPPLLFDYAAAGADVLLATIPAPRLTAARAAATLPPRPLVSNVVPHETTVTETATGVTLRFTPPVDTTLAGEPAAPQYAPCAALARPYAQVMLDPRTAPGTEVLLRSATTDVLDIHLLGYDAEGFTVITAAPSLRPGGTYTFTTDQTVRGILLAPRTGAACATGTLPPFEVAIEVRR